MCEIHNFPLADGIKSAIKPVFVGDKFLNVTFYDFLFRSPTRLPVDTPNMNKPLLRVANVPVKQVDTLSNSLNERDESGKLSDSEINAINSTAALASA